MIPPVSNVPGVHSPSVAVEEVSFAYDSDAILAGESFSIAGPGLVTVLGPNGSGKTTLFKLILGILKPSKGRVLLNGEDVTGDPVRAGVHASYVPQLSAVRKDIPMTGLEAVEAAIATRFKGSERAARALEALRAVGAESLASKRLSAMSGGQLQRVLIARALARSTPILLMDEPLSGIDPRGREGLVDLIAELSKSKLVLVTTHDPVLFLNRSKTIIVFNRGVKAVGSPRDVFKLDLLRAAYGSDVLLIEKCLHVVA